MIVTVLGVADLHQRRQLFDQLADAVTLHKPDVLCCIGDFLDAMEPSTAPGMLTPEQCADRLSSLVCDVVLSRGNHEDENWFSFERQWRKSGKTLNALHGSAYRHGQLIIVGFPCWTGSGDASYSVGRELPNYAPDLWLRRIIQTVGPAARTLWISHEPCTPKLAANFFWEPTWGDAVADWQPRIVVSGHDHTMPIRTGKWYVRIKQTICINCGQMVYPTPGTLQYCVINFTFPGTHPSLPTRFQFSRFG